MPASARRLLYLIDTYCDPCRYDGLSSTKSVRIELLTRQPTMPGKDGDDKGNVDKAVHVETYVKSLTNSRFGRCALNWWLTRSSGHGAFASGTDVRTTLARMTPRRPALRIKRSTVQRATSVPSRRSWRQTLSAP